MASHNYMLKEAGSGMTMFGKDKVTLLQDEVMVDSEILIRYLQEELNGVVGEEYADPCGQGRITIVTGPAEDLYADVTEADCTMAPWNTSPNTAS